MSMSVLIHGQCWFFHSTSSIHANQIEAINNDLESDRMVRALYDIKATDMGSQTVMFKAEVDIDGREITRSYLEKVDIQVLLEV
jgi:solute carrier family 30 (zinc transporter), member 9